MKKLGSTEAELKKSLLIKKKRVIKNNGDVNFIVGIELKDVKGKGIKRRSLKRTLKKVIFFSGKTIITQFRKCRPEVFY